MAEMEKKNFKGINLDFSHLFKGYLVTCKGLDAHTIFCDHYAPPDFEKNIE